MIAAIIVVLLAAAACFTYRLVRGPTMADRVLALDGLLFVGMSGLATHAVHSGITSFIPVIVVVALVGFVGTSVIARFIEGRGR